MKRLLIVEDNEQMRRLIRAVVAPLAQTIYECAVGDEALDSYRSYSPDWVLMDVELPGLDGITATQQITAAFPSARVLIVSDYGTERLRHAARLAGCRSRSR